MYAQKAHISKTLFNIIKKLEEQINKKKKR